MSIPACAPIAIVSVAVGTGSYLNNPVYTTNINHGLANQFSGVAIDVALDSGMVFQ